MSLTLRQRLSPERFLQGEGPEAGPVVLRQRRVFILPTRQGLLFSAILLLMLIGSINYDASLGFALTFLLAALFVVAMLHTYRNLLQLQIDIGPAAPVFCGDTLQIPVSLQNPERQARFALSLHFPSQKRPPAKVICDVPADGGIRVELPLPAKRRGRHALPRITLATVFPLGLFRAWAYAEFDARVLIYPRPAAVSPLPHNRAWQTDLSGDKGKGADDFAGLRPYHPGDAPGHVHWKTAARGQGLHTKQFGGDRAEELWLDWQAVDEGDTEARLSTLTRWVLDADAAQFRYGLRLPNQTLSLAHGPAQRLRCLQALALYANGDDR